MGSQPSVVEIPAGHKIVTRTSQAPSGRNTGFREVQLTPSSEGASTSGQSSARKTVTVKKEDSGGGGGGGEGGDNTDVHAIVGAMQRSKTTMSEFQQPEYGEQEELVLETFYHQNGSVVSCIYQNGQRYYLDNWQSQDWLPFPKKWYKKGILQTDRVVKNDPANVAAAGGSGAQQEGSGADDREGYLEHPTKGKLPTYMFEETRNVHYYYDKEAGSWGRLPIQWELHHELIKKLIAPIEEALPKWNDQHEILATLRANNYDPHETISNYLAVEEAGQLKAAKSAADAKLLEEKDARIKELEEKVQKLKKRNNKSQKLLEEERKDCKAQSVLVQELRENVAVLEAEMAQSQAQLESMQRERPKTARPRTAKEVHKSPVEPETLEALQHNAKQLHKAYSKLKMETAEKFEELKALFRQVAVGVTKISLCDVGEKESLDEIKELYRKEALQRKMLYNKLQELRGNIRVFARCRNDPSEVCVLGFPSDHEIQVPSQKKPFKFDRVFSPSSTQDEVFAETCPIITSCVDGYNVCILAYGQTGSGKTYTMQGPPEDPGVNVRSITELLKICDERANVRYTLKASMVEIYNEQIVDLLSKHANQVDIRSQGNKITLPGLTEMFVENIDDINHIIDEGNKNRHTAATKMNSTSSRSHLVFMITVEGQNKTSGAISTGQLTLCDLAGSERVGKTEATGQRLVEAAAINKSLTALGQVFTALRQGQLHVPYRNSKLTHILQPCLGGDAKAAMFVAFRPNEDNLPETLSTIHFGAQAKQIALGKQKKNVRQEIKQNENAWSMEDA